MPDIMDMPPLRLNLPTEGELSPSEINSLISTATTMRKMDLESKAAARRYRGQQQLQQLISQGVPMDQAMMRVAGDLFHQDPHGFASFYQAEQNRKAAAEYRAATQARLQQSAADLAYDRMVRRNQAEKRIDKPDTSPMKVQLSGINTRIGQAERKMTSSQDEDEKAATAAELDVLYGERETIQNAIKEAGGEVAMTARPTFETKPVVTTPMDLRPWYSRPFTKAPGPVTNVVTRMVPPLGFTPPPPTVATNAPAAAPAPNIRVGPNTPFVVHPDNPDQTPVGPAEAPPEPLPKDKKQLVPGTKYMTRQGPATWDGENFVQE